VNQNYGGIPQLLTASAGPVVFQSFHVRLGFEAALLCSQTPTWLRTSDGVREFLSDYFSDSIFSFSTLAKLPVSWAYPASMKARTYVGS
jgi:hypothetical protein